MKKLVVVFAFVTLMLGNFVKPTVSYAGEVYFEHKGRFWVQTDTITFDSDTGIYSVDVNYGMNKRRLYRWQFVYDSGWFCQDAGSWGKWITVTPDSPNNDILYVVLNNI